MWSTTSLGKYERLYVPQEDPPPRFLYFEYRGTLDNVETFRYSPREVFIIRQMFQIFFVVVVCIDMTSPITNLFRKVPSFIVLK